MRVLTTKTGPCGEPPRTPPVNLGEPVRRDPYSGFLIVRLSTRLKPLEVSSLVELADKLQVVGLGQVLKEFGLDRTRRVVRSLPVEKLLGLEAKARRSKLRPLRSLTAYWRIDARSRWSEVDRILDRLAALPEVEHVYKELATSDPVVNDADDPYSAGQEYLDAAPTGIDARWAWTQPNGEGAGPAFVDLEQGWFLGHEDYTAKSPSLIYGDNRDGVGGYKGNHGTAVTRQIGLCGLALAAKGRYRSRLLLKTTREISRGGHGIAIRQLFEGEEVGRVTWQFTKPRLPNRPGR
jgi:hypothetical protein